MRQYCVEVGKVSNLSRLSRSMLEMCQALSYLWSSSGTASYQSSDSIGTEASIEIIQWTWSYHCSGSHSTRIGCSFHTRSTDHTSRINISVPALQPCVEFTFGLLVLERRRIGLVDICDGSSHTASCVAHARGVTRSSRVQFL